MASQNPFEANAQSYGESHERSLDGIPPEAEYLDDKLCADFVDFVRHRNFAGSTELKDRHSGASIRGYGIGIIPSTMGVIEPRSYLPFNVFLCEDGLLRGWVDGKIPGFNPGSPIKIVSDFINIEGKDPEFGVVDPEMYPSFRLGYISRERRPPVRVTAGHTPSTPDSPYTDRGRGYEITVKPGERYWQLNEQSLEDMLTAYSLLADGFDLESEQRESIALGRRL